MTDDFQPPPPSDSDAPPAEHPRLALVKERAPRSLPHDPNIEQALVGACIAYGNSAGKALDLCAEAGLTSSHLHLPVCRDAYQAAQDIHAEGQTPDPLLVASRIADRHGDRFTELAQWATQTPGYGQARLYATTIRAHAEAREIISAAAELSEKGYGGATATVAHELLERRLAPFTSNPGGAGWTLVTDLAAWLKGEIIAVEPELAPLDNGTCVLYRPSLTWLAGEPGKGKSMLALWWCVQEIAKGNHVVYIDFEGTPQSLLTRARSMGANDQDLVDNFSYLQRMGEPWDVKAMAELRRLITERPPTLVVIDAVAGAMQAENLNNEDNVDLERWAGGIPATLRHAGAAVICIDHVKKDRDTRNGWAIGAQRKKAVADAAFEIEMRVDAGLGRTGYGKLLVHKDRHGTLNAAAQGKLLANIAIHSEARYDTFDLSIRLTPPDAPDGDREKWTPTWYMEQVSRLIESKGPLGIKVIESEIGRTKALVGQAVKRLHEMGHLEIEDVKGKLKPYRIGHNGPYRETPVLVAPAPQEPPEHDYEQDEMF